MRSLRWCRFCLLLIEPRADAPHPRLGLDAPDPIGKGWDAAEILDDVLLRDHAHGHSTPGRIGYRYAEQSLGGKAPLGMMPESPVAEVRQDDFRPIYYMDSTGTRPGCHKIGSDTSESIEARCLQYDD
jgi:hypothetical protein